MEAADEIRKRMRVGGVHDVAVGGDLVAAERYAAAVIIPLQRCQD
jgi:hypothetical protein